MEKIHYNHAHHKLPTHHHYINPIPSHFYGDDSFFFSHFLNFHSTLSLCNKLLHNHHHNKLRTPPPTIKTEPPISLSIQPSSMPWFSPFNLPQDIHHSSFKERFGSSLKFIIITIAAKIQWAIARCFKYDSSLKRTLYFPWCFRSRTYGKFPKGSSKSSFVCSASLHALLWASCKFWNGDLYWLICVMLSCLMHGFECYTW